MIFHRKCICRLDLSMWIRLKSHMLILEYRGSSSYMSLYSNQDIITVISWTLYKQIPVCQLALWERRKPFLKGLFLFLPLLHPCHVIWAFFAPERRWEKFFWKNPNLVRSNRKRFPSWLVRAKTSRTLKIKYTFNRYIPLRATPAIAAE